MNVSGRTQNPPAASPGVPSVYPGHFVTVDSNDHSIKGVLLLDKHSTAGGVPYSFQAFVDRQTATHIAKDRDYDKAFTRGLIQHGRGVWAWEATKKLNRIRTCLNSGTLAVRGEGVADAVGDLFNYTVMYVLFIDAGIAKKNPLEHLSGSDFYTRAVEFTPRQWVGHLIDEGLVARDEYQLQDTIIHYMGEHA